MEIIGPTIRVQNTDIGQWLVTIDRLMQSPVGEYISVSLVIPPTGQTVVQLQHQVVDRAILHLQQWKATAPKT